MLASLTCIESSDKEMRAAKRNQKHFLEQEEFIGSDYCMTLILMLLMVSECSDYSLKLLEDCLKILARKMKKEHFVTERKTDRVTPWVR